MGLNDNLETSRQQLGLICFVQFIILIFIFSLFIVILVAMNAGYKPITKEDAKKILENSINIEIKEMDTDQNSIYLYLTK